MLNPGDGQFPSALHLLTSTPLGPNRKTSPTNNHPLSYRYRDPTRTIPLLTQPQFSKADSTRPTFFQNPGVLTHSDRKTTSLGKMTWMRILIQWSLLQERRTTPSKSRMGHLSTDHHTAVRIVIKRGSSSGTGTSRPLSTRPRISNSSSKILLRINDSWQSLRHHHH